MRDDGTNYCSFCGIKTGWASAHACNDMMMAEMSQNAIAQLNMLAAQNLSEPEREGLLKKQMDGAQNAYPYRLGECSEKAAKKWWQFWK